MDWTQILIAVLGALGLLDLGRLIFFRSSKKKADGEADSAAVAPLKEANDILRQQLLDAGVREAELRETNSALMREKDELHDKNMELCEKNEALASENAAVKQLICVHGGCALREPIRGMGIKWVEEHKNLADLGIDTLSINQLLVQYGKKKAAKKEEYDE